MERGPEIVQKFEIGPQENMVGTDPRVMLPPFKRARQLQGRL
jgi:hypothetical protein